MSQPEDQAGRDSSGPQSSGPPPLPSRPSESSATPPVQNPYAPPQTLAAKGSKPPSLTSEPTVSGNFTQVRMGITTVYYGLNIIALGVLLMIGVVLGNAFLFPGEVELISMLFYLSSGVLLIGALFCFLGPFFCLTVPRETGLKAFVILSVLMTSISLLTTALVFLIAVFGDISRLNLALLGYLPMIGNVVGICGNLMFLLFLARLCVYVERRNLVWMAVVTILSLLLIAAIPVVIIISGANAMGNAGPGGGILPAGAGIFLVILIFGALIGGLIGLLTYVNLLGSLRKHLNRPQFQA